MDKEDVPHLHNGILLSGGKNGSWKTADKWKELKVTILSEVTQSQMRNMVCIHSYMDFRPRENDHCPINHTARETRMHGLKRFIQGASQKGKRTISPEHIGSGGQWVEKEKGRRAEHVGLGRLTQGRKQIKNKGYHKRGSFYRFEEKTDYTYSKANNDGPN